MEETGRSCRRNGGREVTDISDETVLLDQTSVISAVVSFFCPLFCHFMHNLKLKLIFIEEQV